MQKDDDNISAVFENTDGEGLPSFDLQRAMLDATPDCIKIFTPAGILLAMSKAGCLALGVPDSQVKGTPWVPLLPPSIHAAANDALALASKGIAARFAGYSEASETVIYWDNLLTPVADHAGHVQSIVCVSRDVTEQTLLQRELDLSLSREQLLSGEMQHRIKNLFTVVNAVLMMAEKEAQACGAPDQLSVIATGKLGALSRAYETVLAGDDISEVEMEAFVGSVLRPFGARCRVGGVKQPVPGRLANSLALFLHELATNSVKHGALSVPDGEVHISWDCEQGSLGITWIEVGGPAVPEPPSKYGFGTKMIDRLATSSGGAIVRNWLPGGLRAELKIPVHGS